MSNINSGFGKVSEAEWLLQVMARPLRIPTLTWLFSDYFGIIDIEARNLITSLINSGMVKNTGMGWIELTRRGL